MFHSAHHGDATICAPLGAGSKHSRARPLALLLPALILLSAAAHAEPVKPDASKILADVDKGQSLKKTSQAKGTGVSDSVKAAYLKDQNEREMGN
jgi:hypothetical protein